MPPSPLPSLPSCLWQQQQDLNCKDEVGIYWSPWKGTFFFPQAYSGQAVCHPLLAATFFASCLTLGFHEVVYLPCIFCGSLYTCHTISCLFPFGIMPCQWPWTPTDVSVPCYHYYCNPSTTSAKQKGSRMTGNLCISYKWAGKHTCIATVTSLQELPVHTFWGTDDRSTLGLEGEGYYGNGKARFCLQ